MSKYQERFLEVVSYIEANLDSELDIEKLCSVVSLSKYHFHRQCSAFFGMSVMSLVKLLRIKQAAYQLAYRSDMKVIDIAFANGYESHEAFSRSFKKIFKKAPSDFCLFPDWAPWHSQYEPIFKLRNKIMQDKIHFNVKTVEYPETLIAAMEHRGAPNLLGNTIRKFITWRKENRLPPNKSKTFNLLYDDPEITSPEDYRFDVCCSVPQKVEENSSDVVNKLIPAGECALVRHVGSDDSIATIVNYLYSDWLPKSGFVTRDFPLFLERVNFFPDVPENELVTDIYLPIEQSE